MLHMSIEEVEHGRKYVSSPWGRGAGGYAIRLFSNSLPLYIPFLTKGTPFVYLPLKICTLFTYLIHENKSVIKEVFRSFS